MYLEDYRIFKTYRNLADAEELREFFDKHQIPSDIIDDSKQAVDSFYIGDIHQERIQFLIPQALFDKANKLLEIEAENIIKDIPDDYYLYSFSNEELYAILLKPDEWGKFDQVLSKKILASRGQTINDTLLESLGKQRLADLHKPDEENRGWIIVAYILALLGGLLGILLGYIFWNSKKTLPNGEKIYRYSEKQQGHGKIIFIIGIINFILWIFLRAYDLLDNLYP